MGTKSSRIKKVVKQEFQRTTLLLMQGYREKDPCIDQEAGSYQTLTPLLGLPFESCKKHISVPSKLPVSGILFYQQSVK